MVRLSGRAAASGSWRAVPSLTIWVYDSTLGAAAGEVRFKELVRRGAVLVTDAVTVTWVKGTHRPHVGHLRRRSAQLDGSLLGGLVDLLADDGPEGDRRVADLARRLAGTGIDQGMLDQARCALAPGTSALLVLARDVDLAVVRPIVERGRTRRDVVMVHADLTAETVDLLRDAVQGSSR
ncbi:putative membrane protein [Nocardioides sp. J9]|nr:putative membrane protein [Nocardioides sp. J9]